VRGHTHDTARKRREKNTKRWVKYRGERKSKLFASKKFYLPTPPTWCLCGLDRLKKNESLEGKILVKTTVSW